jgi:hypothetical protein
LVQKAYFSTKLAAKPEFLDRLPEANSENENKV